MKNTIEVYFAALLLSLELASSCYYPRDEHSPKATNLLRDRELNPKRYYLVALVVVE
jgi:hypothetical protein